MWPWSQQPDITVLLTEEEEESDQDEDGAAAGNHDADGLLVLQAPGGGDGSRRAGAYSVAADFAMEGELLQKAITRVKWLTVSFAVSRDRWMRGQLQSPTQGTPSLDNGTPLPPFPRWIFCLKDLRGLNLQSYPHTTLPEEMGDLAALERFHAYGSSLTRLPRSMGRLENLAELDCYTSYNLHYLPYEISRCPKLRSSRFSTRALYNNYKNRMPLPPLAAATNAGATITPDLICQVLAQVRPHNNEASQIFPPSLTDHHILPFLHWDFCSVCDKQYELDQGCHVWAHTGIATDDQALLAFCCSAKCANRVPNQWYFDPVSRKNQTVTNNNNNTAKFDFPLEDAIQAWKKASCSLPCDYRTWTLEHLGKGTTVGLLSSASSSPSIMHQLSWKYQFHRRPRDSHSSFMKVAASGDIREQPNSSSKTLGRLNVGAIVLVDDKRHVDPDTGREWARLRFCSKNVNALADSSRPHCWTALEKKDGTVKLVPLKRGY